VARSNADWIVNLVLVLGVLWLAWQLFNRYGGQLFNGGNGKQTTKDETPPASDSLLEMLGDIALDISSKLSISPGGQTKDNVLTNLSGFASVFVDPALLQPATRASDAETMAQLREKAKLLKTLYRPPGAPWLPPGTGVV